MTRKESLFVFSAILAVCLVWPNQYRILNYLIGRIDVGGVESLGRLGTEFSASLSSESCSPPRTTPVLELVYPKARDSNVNLPIEVRLTKNNPAVVAEFQIQSDLEEIDLNCLLFFYFKLSKTGTEFAVAQNSFAEKNILRVVFYLSSEGIFELTGSFRGVELPGISGIQFQISFASNLKVSMNRYSQNFCHGGDHKGSWRFNENWQTIPLVQSPASNPLYNSSGFTHVRKTPEGKTYELFQHQTSLQWQWRPFFCRYRQFIELKEEIELQNCLKGKWIHLDGDSINRLMYYDIVSFLNEGTITEILKHGPLIKIFEKLKAIASFSWHPFAHRFTRSSPTWNQIFENYTIDEAVIPSHRHPDVWVFNSGLWEARDGVNVIEYEEFYRGFCKLVDSIDFKGKLVFRLTTPISENNISRQDLMQNQVYRFNKILRKLQREDVLYCVDEFLDSYAITWPRLNEPDLSIQDGVHFPGIVSKTYTNILLNMICRI